ncbi:MAG: hypothetical protein QM817_01820 [Archangium sp.]
MKKQLALAISLVVCATGCPENKDQPTPEKKDEKAKVAVEPTKKDTPPAEPTAAAGKFKANAEVIEMLKKIVAGCTVSVDSPAVYSCKAEEDRALSKYINDSKPKDLYETYASLLDSTDMKMRAAAVAEAENGLFQCDADVLKENARKDVAQAFLAAFSKNDDYARQLSQSTVALSFLAGLNDELFKAVESVKEDAQTRAYIRYLQYGRLAAFPKLQEAAKKKEIARDAMIAPRYMTQWTDDEKAAICPWAKGFLNDADQYTAKEAGSTLIECGGEYIDTLLDEGEKRMKDKTLDDPFVSLFNEVCNKYIFQPEAETNPQCKRDYVLLEKIVQNKTMKADVRSYALFGLYSQRRNKEVLAVLKKYKKDKTPEISKKATELIESLAQSGIK